MAKEFTDIGPDSWGYDELQEAVEAGIIKGYPDGSFKPDAPLSRQEMAVMCGRLLKVIANMGKD